MNIKVDGTIQLSQVQLRLYCNIRRNVLVKCFLIWKRMWFFLVKICVVWAFW